MSGARRCEARWLGRVPYAEGLELQQRLVRELGEGAGAEHLLLLEHPHVITLGRNARPEHVLIGEAMRQARGVALYPTGRGGDVTYHGPGQLVGYPILDLKPDRCDVRRYVRDLEEALIRTAADFGVTAGREPGLTGIWVETMQMVRVFDQLIYNVDRNMGNLLITTDWHVWAIDHTRAFRLHKTLAKPEHVARCDRGVFERLKHLDKEVLERELGEYLTGWERDAVLARRDEIVKIIEKAGEAGLFDRRQS